MPQISLYIDEDTLKKITEIAKNENISISRWVGANIRSLIKQQYPRDFFSLFGAIHDSSFQRPAELNPVNDHIREEF